MASATNRFQFKLLLKHPIRTAAFSPSKVIAFYVLCKDEIRCGEEEQHHTKTENIIVATTFNNKIHTICF